MQPQCNHKQRNPSSATTSKETPAGHATGLESSSVEVAPSSERSSVERGSESAEPQHDSSPNLPEPSPVKLPNVAFWRPKERERWCNHKQRNPSSATTSKETPAGHATGLESSSVEVAPSSERSSVERGSETAEPQQDSSPNLPEPSPVKLPNVAFWRPKKKEKDDVTTSKETPAMQPQAKKPQQCNHKQRNPSRTCHRFGKQLRGSGPFLRKELCRAWFRNGRTLLPNVAFWRPKETERWCNATTNKRWCNHQDQGPKNARIQASSGSQFLVKGLGGACMRNRETLAGFKPKPAKTIPRKTA